MMALLLTVASCGENRRAGSERLASPNPGETSESRIGYAYPVEPPVVHAASLQAYLRRFVGHPVLLYVWSDNDAGATLTRIAGWHERYRENGLKAVGLFVNSPDKWKPLAVPLLQSSQANYPCAVVPPDHAPGIATWLSQGTPSELTGFYLLDREGRCTRHLPPDAPPDTVESLLSAGNSPSDANASAVIEAGVTLVDARTGRVIAKASARADRLLALDAIAAELARQLSAAEDPQRRQSVTAILPLHERTATARSAKWGSNLATAMNDAMRGAGWIRLETTKETTERLARWGLDSLAVEFDVRQLPADCPWERLIIGSIRVGKDTLSQ
jgi:hypothetical protein